MGPDDYSDNENDDFADDDFADDGGLPDPSERTWRHPSEIAAQARADAELAESIASQAKSATKTARVPSPVLIAAAGFVFGIVMVGLIQSSRNTSEEVATPNFALTPANEAISFPSRPVEATAPTTVEPVAQSLVPTTYTSPKLEIRLARPEGVFRVYASDQETILASAVATEDMILTSASCLEGHEKVYLSSSLGSATMMEATIVGTDGYSDLAVLTTGQALGDFNLAHSPLHDKPGREQVTVIGGGETFLTNAASGKVLQLDTRTKSANGYQLAGIASTSVQVSKQEAGAGLFDSEQVLLGLVVNTDEHLASVLPIEHALQLAHSLARTGWISANWAGIAGSANPDGGVLVDTVSTDSPASLAGVAPGDSIVSIDGSNVASMADLVHYIRALESGSTIRLTLQRGNETVEVLVVLGTLE